MIVENFLELNEFVDNQGRLIVRILKALHCLVQSPVLWFTLIYGFLVGLGFKSNWVSKCVLNMSKDGMVLTLVLYVDDLLIWWHKIGDMEWLVGKLREKFDTLTVETSDTFMYLSMYIEIDRDGN